MAIVCPLVDSHIVDYLDLPSTLNLAQTSKYWWSGFEWLINDLKTLEKMNLVQIPIHSKVENIFMVSCHEGLLDIAKWIYDHYNMNIHMDSDWTFRMSCSNGHPKMSGWLYSIGIQENDPINILATVGHKFEWSHKNEYLEVANLLHRLEPNLKFVKYSDKIMYYTDSMLMRLSSKKNQLMRRALMGKRRLYY